ncbi:hypothetical protein HMPREF0322_00882 [Desulfitobacterium hafniense DP7]|uniref:Uncharacterized protein n=1 Tax=Desulfitobacterium hafniense DP7 TaxID=537010 RepID=G9XIV6_DESHA|nr:hypothetical protein HMPREF0322_00882 [Desulfitobacterium hafniense DP7]
MEYDMLLPPQRGTPAARKDARLSCAGKAGRPEYNGSINKMRRLI